MILTSFLVLLVPFVGHCAEMPISMQLLEKELDCLAYHTYIKVFDVRPVELNETNIEQAIMVCNHLDVRKPGLAPGAGRKYKIRNFQCYSVEQTLKVLDLFQEKIEKRYLDCMKSFSR
jgi:hypothetical protein